jgi:dephospho-CoA kinase
VLVVGLTGGMGAGKSTAATAFAALGAAIIDVDRLGHVVLEPGGRAHAAVLHAFGTVDRRELGAIVFRDTDALARLTAISHPAINAELADRLRDVAGTLPRDGIVVLDMAILAESNLGKGMYDVVVTVEAPIELRVARAVARGMAEEDVRRRIDAQASEDDRRALAAHVLVNDGDEAALVAQVDACWGALVSRARR